ncbi:MULTISPECIES: pyridoxal phosphate-dependent aminotransferase [unclassified Clostridioides]|uniref:pyridoxal phosphate-dependent aminotransferase n=1 Tax=unclassified Clostridioides TaxID=2635829 RepID=UPI001D0CAAFA|nr:pyridoxal phosphate-dependent aminotransferase [Clostridioides sp. ES-S-0001-02]MCC0654902.1 pyridoxal phosphate-dependent aminotransferase [Clostridioides sp. ES-S-0001-03]MCC0658647.1 pyridoxal phosphate-dependent aminotransferase [Clostridioides sp. ES-S-0123-01]MCC0765227.1 pyridoxal phosphate-dependent aminotransferase [Clostridioides sp. ES-S-0006-03]UDN58388.1 pyridoxal phosphate-dependent aminotransferase [Clostridioides sp. ES-S-0010-02]UDN62082.1 pyridoxal phosphate-dependent amin
MLSKRLNFITPSYTIGISSKVKEMESDGIKVINLSIGEPDFNVPNVAKSYGIDSLNKDCTKYDLVPGLKILREEICKKLIEENNCKYSIDEIVISSGAKNSITNTLLALTDEGDEVLLPKPYWVSYPEMVKLVNAVPIFIDTRKENGFKLTKEELEKSITSKTKILVINNPSNPTGSVYTRDELIEIVKVCIQNKIYILADEIYEKICYTGNFTSVASLNEEAKDITITINGFSKSAAMTGLRLGYTASNKTIAKAMSSIQGHLISHPSLTSQYIAYGALKDCSTDIDDMVETYKSRRDLITSKLDSIENVDYVNPDGAFYAFIDLSKIAENFKYKDSFSIEFCNQFLEEYNVAVVPGIAFGMDKYIRISYACNENTFLAGLDKLKEFVSKIMA